MHKYEAYRDVLHERIGRLEETNSMLSNRKALLDEDRVSLMLESRALGYFTETDRIIEFGESGTPERRYRLEDGFTAFQEPLDYSTGFRTAGVSVSIVVYIILIVFVREQDGSGKRRAGYLG